MGRPTFWAFTAGEGKVWGDLYFGSLPAREEEEEGRRGREIQDKEKRKRKTFLFFVFF